MKAKGKKQKYELITFFSQPVFIRERKDRLMIFKDKTYMAIDLGGFEEGGFGKFVKLATPRDFAEYPKAYQRFLNLQKKIKRFEPK